MQMVRSADRQGAAATDPECAEPWRRFSQVHAPSGWPIRVFPRRCPWNGMRTFPNAQMASPRSFPRFPGFPRLWLPGPARQGVTLGYAARNAPGALPRLPESPFPIPPVRHGACRMLPWRVGAREGLCEISQWGEALLPMPKARETEEREPMGNIGSTAKSTPIPARDGMSKEGIVY